MTKINNTKEKYSLVGKIVSTHGIKGEVKVNLCTSFVEKRFKKGNVLYIGEEHIKATIDSFRIHKGQGLVAFNNITNINDVLEYVDKNIYVFKDDLGELDDGDYYYDDLIGLIAYTNEDEKIGEVIDIIEVPQGEILLIKNSEGKEKLVPFVKEFIDSVDLDEEKIVIIPIEGLL